MSGTEHEIFWLRLEQDKRTQEARPLPQGITEVNWREPATRTGWLDYIGLKKKFMAVIEEVRPDVVHAGPIQRVALLPALAGFHPLLSMSWGFDMLEDADRGPLWRAATQYVLDRSDWFAADCHTVRRKAQTFGFPPERMTIFPWGVDHEIFQPKDRGFHAPPGGLRGRSADRAHPLVGTALRRGCHAGRLLAAPSRKSPTLRLFMLGGGSQEKQVKGFVKDKGLEERVLFCGYKENESLAQYYRAADVYLSASHVDGSSVALMEAMSCGCPALVSDIPSNLEWVHDGREGWVFKDGSPRSLAQRIVEIARNRREVPEHGAAAQLKAEQDADWGRNFKKLLQTYQKLTP